MGLSRAAFGAMAIRQPRSMAWRNFADDTGMSVLGTGIASGVAQTAQKAQQVAGQRDRVSRQEGAAAQRLKEMVEARLHELEEIDDVADIRIDGQVPEHERHPDHPDRDAPDGDRVDVVAVETADARDDDLSNDSPDPHGSAAARRRESPLYKHLDVQA